MKILRKQNTTLADLLSPELWAELCAAGRRETFADGQLIEERGDKRPGISLVTQGEIAAGNLNEDGAFLFSALLRKGECYGELTMFLGRPQTHSLWAVGPTEIVFINSARLTELLTRRVEIYDGLLKLMLLRNIEILDFLDAKRRLPLPLQIARLLIAAPGIAKDTEIIECRQEDLADTLGVSRVAIGKALKKLERDELITIRYGAIEIRNRATIKSRLEGYETQNL